MKGKLMLAGLALSLTARAGLNVGDLVPNLCWQDVNEKSVCLDDYKNSVRLLIFSAGY